MESLGRHIRFADNGELVPQMHPVRSIRNPELKNRIDDITPAAW